MKKKKEERKMKKEGREDLKATHGYGIKISFLAIFLFYLFIFISSCSNPFFPEKKDNGGNGGAICLCCDTDECGCADCDNGGCVECDTGSIPCTCCDPDECECANCDSGGCVECDTGSTPCTCCDPDECECDDCDNGDCAECDAVLTPIESLSVTVTPPVKGETPDVTAVVVDDGNYIATVEWNPAVASVFLGETVYTAVITLTADAGYTFAGGLTGTVTINSTDVKSSAQTAQDGRTAQISKTFAETLPKNVEYMEIESQPANLVYVHGETLDLTGLVIKLVYSDTTTDNIALADFEEKGITTSLANGIKLSHSTHNGASITVTFGTHTAETDNLTVNKANPVVAWPVIKAAAWQTTLSQIWLPDNFAWKTPDTAFANGTAYPMTFTPDDVNYNTVEENVAVTVAAGSTSGTALIEMVWIPAGTFQMGSADAQDYNAQPPHQVTLKSGFYMGRYEVTQAQYQAVMGTNPSNFASGADAQNRPVETVNWYHAIAFCNRLSILEGLTPVYTVAGKSNTDADAWLHSQVPTSSNADWNAVTADWNADGYRLPTEAQWEYACRAGTTTAWSYGDTENGDYMWFSGNNSPNGTKPVGTKLYNDWGLYDMHGNVWEWVWDWFGSYTDSAKEDPRGAVSGDFRVIRGSSWGDNARNARSAVRDIYGGPGSRGNFIGFRLVRP